MSTAYANFGRNIACALFSQIAQVVYTETLKSNLASVAKSGKVHQTAAVNLVSLADNSGLLKMFSKDDQLIIKGAFMKSIRYTFYFCIGLSALSLICSLLMPNARVPVNKDKNIATSESDIEKN
ncbi:unnamed protein product [Ambrosiozyma monospora]|uniref:Unnamed protein product n=1 Tax=Ambrosiozyma monospora TaxID=43982 RepID=A0ACB5T7H9_AMBMO|nr:unnamed protein product [Ambrosiozyma monospora]